MIQGILVRLRPVEREDLKKTTAMLNKPAVAINLGGLYFGISLKEEEAWYENHLKEQYQLSSLVIEDLKTGEHLGHIGFNQISWKNRKATVGLFIDENYWGQGFGTDALMTFCHFGFTQLNFQRIQLLVFATNVRGISLYEKCGFQVEVVQKTAVYVDGIYVDQLLMGVLVEEFLPIYEGYMV